MREGKVREGKVREGKVREGKVREGKVREGKVREGKVREGKVREGKVREGKVREGKSEGNGEGSTSFPIETSLAHHRSMLMTHPFPDLHFPTFILSLHPVLLSLPWFPLLT